LLLVRTPFLHQAVRNWLLSMTTPQEHVGNIDASSCADLSCILRWYATLHLILEQLNVVETSFRRKHFIKKGQKAIRPWNNDQESKCFGKTLLSKQITQKCSVCHQNFTPAELCGVVCKGLKFWDKVESHNAEQRLNADRPCKFICWKACSTILAQNEWEASRKVHGHD